jgi:hypothetical protein
MKTQTLATEQQGLTLDIFLKISNLQE